jgi:hypothetical protein
MAAAAFAPCIAGRPVDMGHYCESFRYAQKKRAWLAFLDPATPDDSRRNLLRQTGVRYLLFSQKRFWVSGAANCNVFLGAFRFRPPQYLRRVQAASNADADVYEVLSSKLLPQGATSVHIH